MTPSPAAAEGRMQHDLGMGRSEHAGADPVPFVRYEASAPNARGVHIGVFGLVNGLARSGSLTEEEWRWWRGANDWLDGAYPDPGTVDPTLFDKTIHPAVTCWFKSSAAHLLDRLPGYLDLLDRYDIAWVVRRSADPGPVLYEDDVQIVVVEGGHPAGRTTGSPFGVGAERVAQVGPSPVRQ